MSPLIRSLPLVVLLTLSAAGQELNEKAARYYESLRKRPAPGPVFDRFVDAWLDSGTLEQLEAFLSEKTKAAPSAPAHLLLGLYYVRQGSHARAVGQYRAALTLEPDNPSLWQQKALAESRLLEFDQAIASLEKGLEKKPSDEQALNMRQLLGRLLSRAGRTTDALAVWQKLMTERPDDEALREDVLDLQLVEGLFDAAVENATALVDRAPDAYKKAMRRLQLAEVMDRAGRADTAMAELEKCLADSGADSWLEKEVLARLDRIFRRDDNLSGLRAHLEVLAQRQPQRHGLARARVRLLAELGEKSAAVEAGRALLTLAPGDRAAREEFIVLLVEAGRLEEAVAQAAELRRQSPQDRELLLRLAALKLQAGDKAGCLAAVTEYDSLSGGDEAARLRSAALLEKAGLVPEAITRLQDAAKSFPASAAVSNALASSLHRTKRRDEALAEWKRQAAAAKGPALQDVARALSAHGEDEAAWELLIGNAASGDAPLLTQLCQLAERLERAEEALPHARRLVGKAQNPPDMEAALELASRLIKRAGESDSVIASIGADAGVADLCLLAELLEMRGDSSAAEDALQRAGRASQDLAAARLVRLYSLRQAWPQALEAGAKLFAAPGGKKAATAQMLADVAEHARDLEAALHWTREWRKLSPGAAPAVLAETRLLRSMGKDDEALKSLRLASGQFEENREIRTELARLSRDTGRTSEALSLYAGLYEQAPEAAQKLLIVHEWAEAALEANRLTEMLEQFDERRRQNRNATGPLLALAEIHEVNGDREGQRRVLTDATRLRPEDADLALSLADMQEADDLVPLAIDTLRAALPHDKSGRVRHRLARLHFNAGNQVEGMKLIEEPADGTPPDAAAVESMALALIPTDPERVLALLTPRIAADPSDYRLRFLRASVLAELGQHTEAIREWSSLMAIRQENPAVGARRSGAVFSPDAEIQVKKYAGVVPEEILHVLRVHDLLSQNLRQQQWSTRYNSAGQATSAWFQPKLPGSQAELRALVAAALLNSAKGEGETVKLASAALAADGMAELTAILGDMDENQDPFANPSMPGLAQRRRAMELIGKDDAPRERRQPLRSGIFVLRSITGNDDSQDPAAARVVWEDWHRTHPDFALASTVASFRDSPVALESELAAVQMLLSLERPHDLVLRGITKYLKKGGAKRMDGGRTHTAVLNRVAAWLESDWIAAPAYAAARIDLAVNMIKCVGEMPELAARVMNAEWPREEKSSGAAGLFPVTPTVNSSAVSVGFLSALGWPVSSLPGVSPVFARGNEAAPVFSGISRDDAAKVVPLLKHPVLAAWLQDHAARARHPLPALTKLAADAAADPAALVMAAVSFAEAEQFPEAAQLAVRALERPLPADLRRKLNASIVTWADESMAANGTLLHSAAREAALRLRRDAQSLEQKAELVAAMESLGMTAEASAIKSARVPGGWSTTNLAAYLRNGNPGGPRLQMLMREAKREINSSDASAAATVAKVLRRQARYMLSPAGWGGNQENSLSGLYFSGSAEDDVRWPEFLKLLTEKKNLEEPALAALTAGIGSDPRQRGVLGAAHEVFSRSDRAIELYREAIAAGCSDPGVHVRLTFLLFRSEKREEAERAFIAAPPEAQDWLAGVFLQKGERETMETVLRAAAMTQTALENSDPARTNHSGWLTRMVILLREDLEQTTNLRAPKLEGPADGEPVRRPNRPDASPEEFQKAKEQLVARRGAHDMLCRRLLTVPGAEAFAFRSLRQASGPEADLTREAVTAFVTGNQNAFAANAVVGAMQMQQQMLMRLEASRSDGQDGFSLIDIPFVDGQEAMDYLLTTCVRQNQAGPLRKELIPSLQKAGATRLAEQVALLTAIYFDPPNMVEENARRLIALGGVTGWPVVVRGLEHRHAAVDLSALLIADLTRARTRPDDLPFAVSAAGDYCAWLCREGRHPQARALLDRVLDILTGSGRQCASAFTLALSNGMRGLFGSMLGNGVYGGATPAQEAMQLLGRLVAAPASTFVALDATHDRIVPAVPSDIASALLSRLDVGNAPFTKPDFYRDVVRVRQFFTGSPLVADVDKFRAYGGGGGVFFTVAGTLYEMGFEERKPALAVLRSLPPAYGRDMLIAAAEDRWNGDALNAAAVHFDRIKALPPAAQAEVADLLAAISSGRDTLKFSSAARDLMKWVNEQQALMMGEETEKRIEAFLATRTSSGGGLFSRNDPVATAAPLLEAAIKAMSPRAFDVVRRTSVMVPRSEAPESMGWLLSGFGSSIEHMVLAKGAGTGQFSGMPPLPSDRSAFRLGILTNAMCANDKRVPLFIEPLRLSLPRTVRWITDKLKGSAEERLTALANALAGQVKEGEACVLLEAFPMPVTNSDTPEARAALRTAAIAWADGAGKSLPRQDIVREIAAAARLEQFMESQPRAAGIEDETALPPEQSHYLAVMRDESRGSVARLAVASLLADFAGPWLEPPLVAQVAATFEKSLNTRRPMEPWQRTAILRMVSRSMPSPVTDTAVKSLLARLPFDEDVENRLEAKHFLALALRANDSDAVAKSLAALQRKAGDPDALGLVLASGDATRIANIVRDGETRFYYPALCSGEVMFDDLIARALTEVLPGVSPDARRFRFELSAHCLPSAPGMKSRTERMLEISRRLESVMEGFSPGVRHDLLDLLIVEPSAALPFRRYFDEECPEKSWKEILQETSGQPASYKLRFWMMSLYADAVDGNVASLTKRMDLLNERAPDDPFSSDGSRGPGVDALRHLSAGIAQGWPQWNATRQTAVQQWIVGRLKDATLPGGETAMEELSRLPRELIEAINNEVKE